MEIAWICLTCRELIGITHYPEAGPHPLPPEHEHYPVIPFRAVPCVCGRPAVRTCARGHVRCQSCYENECHDKHEEEDDDQEA